MVSSRIRTSLETPLRRLRMVFETSRNTVRAASGRFPCGYGRRNRRNGGFFWFISAFPNTPQFLEPFPIPGIIFPLPLRSWALGRGDGSIFRHFSSYLYLRPKIFGERQGGPRPGRAHHSGRGGVFEVGAASDLQGFVGDFPAGFKGS